MVSEFAIITFSVSSIREFTKLPTTVLVFVLLNMFEDTNELAVIEPITLIEFVVSPAKNVELPITAQVMHAIVLVLEIVIGLVPVNAIRDRVGVVPPVDSKPVPPVTLVTHVEQVIWFNAVKPIGEVPVRLIIGTFP